MRYRSIAGRETTTTPAAQADHGLTPDSVTQSPRQQQQASQIAALRLPAAAPGGAIQLMQGQGQPSDDRNWWQRYAPYALGGKAPQENRGYLERWLPTALGGKPEPQAPAPTTTRSVQAPRTKTRKEIIKLAEQERAAARKKERKQAALLPKDTTPPREEPSTSSPFLDLDFASAPSKASRRRANLRARREEEEERERVQAELELQRRRAAIRKLPRRVRRYDDDFKSAINHRDNQGKSHRIRSDLVPAGNTQTTAVEQLHQESPNKGTSNRTSFFSKRAKQANDYGAGGTRPWVEFKARKHARATLKGKQDALGFDSFSAQEVLRQVDADTTGYATARVADKQGTLWTRKASARNFARHDDESQTRGRIPARFLRWSNTVGSDPSDSDSDDETTDEE